MIRAEDDRGRHVFLARPPTRVVSLCPSDTYTVARLCGVERLVGRTVYCDEPKGAIEGVPSVGGTKDASVEAILALAPDLVIANQEENTRPMLEAIALSGVPLFVVFPRRVEDGVALVARLAKVLGVQDEPRARELVRACHGALQRSSEHRASTSKRPPLRVFCPIWADPLMTIHRDTYISDALDLAGARNVFADRARRYPLAADLGRVKALADETVRERDTRYPRITEEELIAQAPEVVLLPDEPHPFTEAEAEHFRSLPIPGLRVVHVAGKDLCWYGAWSEHGIPRLASLIESLR